MVSAAAVRDTRAVLIFAPQVAGRQKHMFRRPNRDPRRSRALFNYDAKDQIQNERRALTNRIAFTSKQIYNRILMLAKHMATDCPFPFGYEIEKTVKARETSPHRRSITTRS